MSYSITISGHKNVASQEEGQAFEEGVAEKAREFVKSLGDTISVANGSFGHLGYINLAAPAEEGGEANA